MAPPRLTMKLACLDEISAPLMRLPLSPAFSIEPGGQVVVAGFFHTQPAEASASGCVDFFTLSRCLMSFWISAQRPAVQLQPAADQHRAGRRVERAVGEGAAGRLELPERAVRMQVVDGADEVADAAVGGARVHGQRAADRGGDADQALDAAQVEGGRLADERRQADAGAGHGLLAVELGPARGTPRASGRRRGCRDRARAGCCRRRAPPPAAARARRTCSAWRMSSTSCGTTKMSAAPPMRSEVWKLRGSLKRTSPRISPSMWSLPFGDSASSRRRMSGPSWLDVAGAQRQHQIARRG